VGSVLSVTVDGETSRISPREVGWLGWWEMGAGGSSLGGLKSSIGSLKDLSAGSLRDADHPAANRQPSSLHAWPAAGSEGAELASSGSAPPAPPRQRVAYKGPKVAGVVGASRDGSTHSRNGSTPPFVASVLARSQTWRDASVERGALVERRPRVKGGRGSISSGYSNVVQAGVSLVLPSDSLKHKGDGVAGLGRSLLVTADGLLNASDIESVVKQRRHLKKMPSAASVGVQRVERAEEPLNLAPRQQHRVHSMAGIEQERPGLAHARRVHTPTSSRASRFASCLPPVFAGREVWYVRCHSHSARAPLADCDGFAPPSHCCQVFTFFLFFVSHFLFLFFPPIFFPRFFFIFYSFKLTICHTGCGFN